MHMCLFLLIPLVVGQDIAPFKEKEDCGLDDELKYTMYNVIHETLARLMPRFISDIKDTGKSLIELDDESKTLLVQLETLEQTVQKIKSVLVLNEAFCTFEPQDDCFLENSTKDDFDWNTTTGSTPSSYTGPIRASGGLYYSYIEVSSPRKPGDTASLVSKVLIAGGQKCLHFDYHMTGDNIGTLKVFTLKENTVNEIFYKVFEQGNHWNSAVIPLTSVEKYKLRFDGIRGSGFEGDIAIDNIKILQGNCDNIRLVGGSSAREGRIEVYTQGKWGTICDDSFGNNDGHVVCKMLGFNRVVSVRTQAYFGKGTGSIVMDEVACSGSESSIFECSYSRSHDCSHSEDVGVQCD